MPLVINILGPMIEDVMIMLHIELFVTYEAQTLLRLSVFRCRTRVVSDNDTTPIHIITLDYVIFSNY